ncbi:DUF4335 domain-containing protein [Synechococcus sp. CCY 9618]|uniref:DUF4335 domain-containing protein n=1 Tax=Synechococcus sp. CCY 9618 TaxID=2815602 RepID=UPI001C21F55E|nr:DUF4335 domain-containing protein [Synechococcus sp. CCY 9618]
MVQSAAMKQRLVFDQLSCRLQVDGLPDVSVGQSGTALGIITGWSLQWVGRPLLEGRREHLQALMQVVFPYARHLISGVRRDFSVAGEPVDIGPHAEGGHRLLLRSSQPDTPPLEMRLDDAELADLVRVLDQLRLDPRLQLPLAVPEPEPLGPRELLERIPLRRRLTAPLGGAAVLAVSAALVLLLPPPPQPPLAPPAAPASEATPAGSRP